MENENVIVVSVALERSLEKDNVLALDIQKELEDSPTYRALSKCYELHGLKYVKVTIHPYKLSSSPVVYLGGFAQSAGLSDMGSLKTSLDFKVYKKTNEDIQLVKNYGNSYVRGSDSVHIGDWLYVATYFGSYPVSISIQYGIKYI